MTKVSNKGLLAFYRNAGLPATWSKKDQVIILDWVEYGRCSAWEAAKEKDEIISSFRKKTENLFSNVKFGRGDGNGGNPGAFFPVFAWAEM